MMLHVAERQVLAAAQPAEWLPARLVLTCRPGTETLFALLETQSANFLHPFSLEAARAEHDAFTAALSARGVMAIDLRAALAWGAKDDPQARSRLEGWALSSIQIYSSELPGSDAAEVRANLSRTLAVLSPADLAEVILLRPSLRVLPNPQGLDDTTRFTTGFQVSPLSNAYFMRDPLFTTAAGCVIGRASLPLRQPENDTAAWALEHLGIRPLLRVESPGTAEGGDFLPAGGFALQGQGLLTNAEGVAQCLESGAYGPVEVAVVKDPVAGMEEMHLDTYFALLGPDLCAICDERLAGESAPRVDVYWPDEDRATLSYNLKERDVLFSDYLQSKGMRVLSFSKQDQLDFASNGLLLDDRDWLGVAQCSPAWMATLDEEGVNAETVDFSALTGGYGGPHCSTQVLLRSGQPLPVDFGLRRMN